MKIVYQDPTIKVKKVKVGTPVKRVTAGSFAITNLGGVDVTTSESDGSIIAYKTSTGNYEVTNLRGSNNVTVTYDSASSEYTFDFTNGTFTGSLIPDSDEAYDLGSSTKKWRDLFLSGNTITLGTLDLKDSNGNFVIIDSDGGKTAVTIKLSTTNSDILSFDSSEGILTFNDSDVARTDIAETFHSDLNVAGNLTVSGTQTFTGGTSADSSTITNGLAVGGSATIGSNLTIGGNLTVSGTQTIVNTETIQLADNTIVLNSNATGSATENAGIEIERGDDTNKSLLWDESNDYWTIGSETFQTTGKILFANVYNTEGDLPSASTYHGMFAHVHATGRGYFAHGGSWHRLVDSDTTGEQQVYALYSNNARITNAQIDSATITNLANTQLTGSQATFDSANIGTLKFTTLTNTTSDITEGTNLYYTRGRFDSALGDTTSIGTIRGYFSSAGDLSYDSSTGVFSFDVEQVYTKSNFDSDLGAALDGGTGITYDSSTDTISITNTGVTAATYGSASQIPVFTVNAQGQLDSAGSVAVAGVSSFSFDSANGNISIGTVDGATFLTTITLDPYTTSNLLEGTNLYYTTTRADSDFDVRLATKTTSDVAEGTNLYYTTARADSDAKASLLVNDTGGDGSLSYDSATGVFTYTGPSSSEVRAHFSAGGDMTYDSSTGRFSIDVEQIYSQANFDSDFATRLQTQIDSASFNVLTAQSIHTDSASFDSATITNLANTQLTGSQATFDSATITNIRFDNVDAQTTTTIRNLFSASGDLSYDSAAGQFSFDVESVYTKANFDSDLGDANTGQLPEGTNLYYTTARADSDAKAALLVNDTGGDGSLTYDSATGVFTYTGPSAAEVRAHLTANKGLTYNSSTGEFNVDSANLVTLSRNALQSGTGVTYDSATGQISIGQPVGTTDNVTFAQTTMDSAILDGINFNVLTSRHANAAGTVFFDSDHQKGLSVVLDTQNNPNPDVTLNLGQEIFLYVHNLTGAAINNGDAVYISGTAHGKHPQVTKARANASGTANVTGLATMDIPDGGHGWVTRYGIVRDVNTGGMTAGNLLYLSPDSAGVVTETPVTVDTGYPFHIGRVLTVDSTAGTILVDGMSEHFDDLRVENKLKAKQIEADSASLLHVQFDTTTFDSHQPYNEGLLYYDNKHKTLNYNDDITGMVHEVGTQEHQRVFNNTGSLIRKGQPLYFSGNYTSGTIDVPTVGLADATDVNAYNAQGIAALDIPNNSYGHCLIAGQLTEVNTAGLSDGTNFFVGLGPGLVQNASPTYPNYPMCLGWVVNSGDSNTGILLVNQQNHSVNSFRVRTSAHIGTDLQVDGNLTILGSQTTVGQSNVTQGSPFYRLNEGDAIGEAGTTFIGTGLDDAFFAGHFTGTTSQTYYVRIDGVGTGAGGVDTFEVALGNDSTFTSPILTKTAITGEDQLIHSTDNISVNFGATTGHDSGDVWKGVASPVNVDTGFFTNRNTGTSGVGYTHMGLYFDVSDEKWKLLDEYDSTPTGTINAGDSSFSLATLVADTFEGNLTGAVTGNASTASALAAGRDFSLTGDITASAVSFDGTGNVQLTTAYNPGSIVNADINAAAAIADTKLATISTAGKVNNSATTATDANTGSTIVARDVSGNFSAGTVTLTGDMLFGDNKQIKLGADSDLLIYHDGTNSYIDHTKLLLGFGPLPTLRLKGRQVDIVNNHPDHDDETVIRATYDTSHKTHAEIYADGVLRIETGNLTGSGAKSGYGVRLSGKTVIDSADVYGDIRIGDDGSIYGGRIHIGGSNNPAVGDGDLQIYHDGSNSYITNAGTGSLKIGGTVEMPDGVTVNGTITADFDRSANTTVTAGTYGSASLVPVLTVDASGFIDSVGTVSVAGVSSTSFDSGTGIFTISTADGGSFATNVTSRISNLPDSDFTINGILGLSDSAGATAPSTIRFNNKRTEFRMNMDSDVTGEYPGSFGGGENRTFAFINASGGDSDLVIIGKDSDAGIDPIQGLGYGYYSDRDIGSSFMKVKGYGSYIQADSMSFTVLLAEGIAANQNGTGLDYGDQVGQGAFVTSNYTSLGSYGTEGFNKLLDAFNGRRGPSLSMGRHVVLGNHNIRAHGRRHHFGGTYASINNNWSRALRSNATEQNATYSARIASKLTTGATTIAFEMGRDSEHGKFSKTLWDSAYSSIGHPVLHLGYQDAGTSGHGYDGYRGSKEGRGVAKVGLGKQRNWDGDKDKLQIQMQALYPQGMDTQSHSQPDFDYRLDKFPETAVYIESFFDSEQSILDSAEARGGFGFEIRKSPKNEVQGWRDYARTPLSILKARGDGSVYLRDSSVGIGLNDGSGNRITKITTPLLVNDTLSLSDSSGVVAPSNIQFNNKRLEFRMNMDSVSTGELPASFGGGENRTFAFINASGGDSDLVIIGKDSDKANSIGNLGYGYYTNEDRGKSFLKVKGFGSYIDVDSMNFTVLDGNSVGYYYNNGGQTGLTSRVDILSQHGGRRGPQANLGRHVVLGNHNLRAQAAEHPVQQPTGTTGNWARALPAHYAEQAAFASARIVSKLTAGATTLAYEFGRDSDHIAGGYVAWDSGNRLSDHRVLRLGYQHPTNSRTGYDGYRGSANGRYYNGSNDKFTWNSTWDSDKLSITMEAMIPNSALLDNAASNKLLNANPNDAIVMESFYDSDRSILDSANSRGHFGFEIRRKTRFNNNERKPEHSTSGSIMKARGDGRVEFGGDVHADSALIGGKPVAQRLISVYSANGTLLN